MSKYSKYLLITTCFTGSFIFAHDAGTTAASLDLAIKQASAGAGGDTHVRFHHNIAQSNQVRAIGPTPAFIYPRAARRIYVDGNGHILSGDPVRGLFVGGEHINRKASVTIDRLRFHSLTAKGGDGADRGGGGLGAGGGFYLGRNARATLRSCEFIHCKAIGGNTLAAPSPASGGGGGLTGNGGMGNSDSIGGGGGFGGAGATNPGGAGGGGGADGFAAGNAVGATPGGDFDGVNTPASSPGIGGMGIMSPSGTGSPGGFGGGGGGHVGPVYGFGGNGGHYGGGGACTSNAGNGGFGGGGGGSNNGDGGTGGFGAGSGANKFGATFTGGFGGGDGFNIGGVGAGFGGAIFIEQGGELTILDSIKLKHNSAAAGTIGNKNTDATAGFGALGPDIFIMSGSKIIFDLKKKARIPSPIESSQGTLTPGCPVSTSKGGLIKKGKAPLQLTGHNTFTGSTIIERGELFIPNHGSVVTDVLVKRKGKLAGILEIFKDRRGHGGNLTNKGVVSPGEHKKTGPIVIERNYKQSPHGKLIIDIKPNGQHDELKLKRHAKADLNGTLEVIVEKGHYKPGKKYVIINEKSHKKSTFEEIIIKGPGADKVGLKVSYHPVVALTITSPKRIKSGIPKEVFEVITKNVAPHSDHATVVKALDTLSSSELNKALISISPVNYGNIEWINARNNDLVADILSEHLFELCCSPRDCCNCNCCNCTCNASFWVEGFGNFMSNTKRFNNLDRYHANAGGFLTGVDWCYKDCCFGEFFLGGSFGYTYTELHWKDKGHGHSNSVYGALYGSWDYFDSFTVDASIIGGGTDYDLKRKLDFASIDRTAKGRFWGEFVTAHLGIQSDWNWCFTVFEPYALVDYNYFNRNHIREHGADSLDLSVRQKTQHLLRAEVGVEAYWTWACACSCFSPYLGLSWVGEFPLNHSKQKANFVDFSGFLDVTSYHSSVQLVSPEAGVKWTYNDGFSWILGYKGLFNGFTCINQIEGRLEWVF